MTWQEDLQRLDEELAAGRLSVDDYRRRRDELIARTGVERGGVTNQDSTASQPPGSQDSPFPPAFRWDPVPSETTQVIKPVGARDAESSEDTQVVRAPGQPQSALPYDDSESTQVVPAAPPPFGRSPRQQGGVSAPSDPQPAWTEQESAPPWLSADVPPIQEPNAGWIRQGPEFFETEQQPSGTGTMRIVAIVAAVVVLAGIAFGAWFVWGRDGSPNAGPQQTAAPTTEQAPADPLAPVDIGGTKEEKDVESFRDLRDVGFLTTEELETLSAAGAAESRLLITNIVQGKATILVSQVVSPSQAATARDELIQLQISYGFTPRSAPTGVTSLEVLNKPGTAPTLRALYASDDRVIRIEMRGNDPTETATEFEEILARQLEKMPANA